MVASARSPRRKRNSVVSFCHSSLMINASGAGCFVACRKGSQEPFGKELSPIASRRQPEAPCRSHCLVILFGSVRKYCCTAGNFFVITGKLSKPAHPL